ncbi:hypothetical protein FQN57_006053 [Myotisia sp. PD_48]|nr:hypothetical protein FQN57_006053 [Myotisia sp. PD_48]
MASSTRLQDKVAIVTGSSDGIGRAIALRYAAEGAYVVCSDINPASRAETEPGHENKPTHEAINSSYPQRAIFVKADVTASSEVENLINECVKKFGRLDIMVNNAGIGRIDNNGQGSRIHETPELSWDKIMGVNEYATAQMLKQEPQSSGDRGWIVNMASILGLVGTRCASAYVASKGAVVNLTKAIALEYGPDKIHVNAIAPGYIETPLIKAFADKSSENAAARAMHSWLEDRHPFGNRLGQAEEIAGAAVFLASADASFVTGHTLAVEGGYVAQ